MASTSHEEIDSEKYWQRHAMNVLEKDDPMKFTGERYLPFTDLKTSGVEIHYEHLHRYAFASQFVQGKNVLDLASGEGYGSYMLSQEADHVVGVEIDPEAVEHARTKYPKDDLEFTLGSILEIPIQGEHVFDVIVCFEAIEHVSDHDKLLSEVKRLLKEDGLFIVSTPNKKIYTDEPNYHNPYHVSELYYGDFMDLLSHYFSDVYSFGQRAYSGSNIWRLSSKRTSGCSEFVVCKAEDGFSFIGENEKSPLYFIAIASNNRLREIQNIDSYFIDTSNAILALREGQIAALTSQLHEATDHARLMEERVAEGAAESEGQITALTSQLQEATTRAQMADKEVLDRGRLITDLTSQIRDASNQIREIKQVVAEKEDRISSLANEIQEKEAIAKSLEQAVAESNSQAAAISDQLQQANIHSAALEKEILDMRRSVVWRLTMGFHNCFVERALPHDTGRRRYYDLMLNGCRILANEGPKRAIWSFKNHRQSQKKNRKIESNNGFEISKNIDVIHKGYLSDLFNRAGHKSSEYVPLSQTHINLKDSDIKLIAFYLPQYHPIPENDEWWGKGFTDWTNVVKAVPQFVGHYQPHLPDELGFYDLRLVEVQKRQIALAKQYGIYGFCFHYYWFNGKRLLEKPLDQFFDNPELQFPFCICWANENWTRRWDGMDNEILIAQTHSAENDIAFIKDLEHFFRDPRYIRINGRPILIVYRIQLLPNPKATAERWKAHCKEQGIGDLYLIAAQTFGFQDPRTVGFDAAVEFPPHFMPGCRWITNELNIINPEFSGKIIDFSSFVKTKAYLEKVPYKLFNTVSPGWDNTARRPNNPFILHGSNPELYKEWLSNVAKVIQEISGKEEKIVFINAWNEWAEGAHLEPDRKYGYGFLQATSEVICDYREKFFDPKKIIFISHDALYYGAQLIALNIIKLLKDLFHYDIYVFLKSGGTLENEFEKYSTVYNLEKDYKNMDSIENLICELRDKGVDLAICNTVVSGDLVKLLHEQNIKTISLIHELPGIIKQYNVEENAQIIAKYADKIVFPSEFVKSKCAEIMKFDEKKSVIIPQGLYFKNKHANRKEEARSLLRQSLSIPEDSKIVLAVGSADFRKGADLFVKIAKNVTKANSSAYFIWVGIPDEKFMKDILSDLKTLRFDDRVRFVGVVPQEDLGLFYAGADLYLLTSREDPFPSTILEAMDSGMPVIGFQDAGGFRDIVTEETGVLIPYLNVEEMSKAVLALLNDSDLRLRLGNQGSELIANKYNFVDYVYSLLSLSGLDYKKVSVILPNYNHERYLTGRFNSIIDQTYPIYEIIFLDDCSLDKSLDVARKFRDISNISIKLLMNNINSGSIFRNWAKGINTARGDYIWITEADDLCAKSFLSEVIKGFDDPDVVLSYAQSKQIDENGNLIDTDYLKYTKDIDENKWKEAYTRDGLKEIGDSLAIKNTIPNASAVVFKKYDIKPILDDLVQYKIAGDWLFYVWILQKGKISFNSKSLNCHRRYEKSTTSMEGSKRHYDEIVKIQDYVMDKFKMTEETRKKVIEYRAWVREYLLGTK